MALRTPCSRHSRSVWIASCDDCTSWHLAGELSRRDAPAPADAGNLPEARARTRGAEEAGAA